MKNWPVPGGPPVSSAKELASIPKLEPVRHAAIISTNKPTPKPLYPPLGAIVPFSAIDGSVVSSPSGPKAHPVGIGSPDLALTAISLLAITLADWSMRILTLPSLLTATEKGFVPITGLMPPRGAIDAGAFVNPIPIKFSLAIVFV